mgnify:CR=1 FL=1
MQPHDEDWKFREYVIDLLFDGLTCKQIIDTVYETRHSSRSQEAGEIAFDLIARRHLNPRHVVCNNFGTDFKPDRTKANLDRLHARRYRVHERAAWLLEQRKLKREKPAVVEQPTALDEFLNEPANKGKMIAVQTPSKKKQRKAKEPKNGN